jgi:hypothetical protein
MNFAGSSDSTAARCARSVRLHGNHGIQRAFEDYRAGRFGEIKPIVAE